MDSVLLEKITAAYENDLIGQTVFSEDDLADIFAFAGSILRRNDYAYGQISISSVDEDIIFIAVVNAIKKWQQTEENDSFFQCIYRNLLGTAYASTKTYNFITNTIQDICNKHDKPFLNSCAKRYYATVLAHAMAPVNAMQSFFDLCWEIFCKDMCLKYIPNDTINSLIVGALSSIVTNEIKDSDDESLNLGPNKYYLKVGLKRLAVDAPTVLEELIDKIVCYYDKVYNKSYQVQADSYLEQLLNDWWAVKKTSIGADQYKRERTYERAAIDYEHINPRYEILRGEVQLIIPPIRLTTNFYTNPILKIYVNAEIKKQCDMYTAGSGLAMATLPLNVALADICVKNEDIHVRIEIEHCGRVIYNSKSSLNREFLLFSEKKELTGCEYKPGNYFVFTTSTDRFSIYPQNRNEISGFVYNVYTGEGDALHCRGKKVFFTNEQNKSHAWIDGNRLENFTFSEQGIDYWVFNEISAIKYAKTDKKFDINQLSVKIDDDLFPITKFEVVDMAEEYSIRLSSCISDREPSQITLINLPTNEVLLTRNVFLLNGMTYTFDKPYYFGDGEIGMLNINYSGKTIEEIFETNDTNYSFIFGNGIITVEIPAIRWRIDDKKWFFGRIDEIVWYKSFHNNSLLELSLPKGVVGNIAINNNIIATISVSQNKYELGKLIYKEKDNNTEDIAICICISGKPIACILSIAMTERFIAQPVIEIKNGILIWDPDNCYIGDADSKFRFTVFTDKGIIFQYDLENKALKALVGDIEEDIYCAKIELKRKALLSTFLLLKEFKFVIGEYKQLVFKNKSIRLKTVMLDRNVDEVEIKPAFIKDLQYLYTVEGFDFYTGTLFIKNQYNYPIVFNQMPNSKGIMEKINPVRIEIRSNNTLWLVVNYQGPGFNDFDGEIFFDTERKMICNNDKIGQSIDYYCYDIRRTDNV